MIYQKISGFYFPRVYKSITTVRLVRLLPLYACMKFGEEKVDGIVDLIMEVYLSVGTICIGKNQIPAEQAKNVFRKINMDHIQYVFNSIEQTSREKKIKNMKSYLLTALYNAPMTIEAYYASESNYDYHNREEG